MRRLALLVALIALPSTVNATGFTDIGDDLSRSVHERVSLDGYFRWRSEVLYNLDLDRDLTPSGVPLFLVHVGR